MSWSRDPKPRTHSVNHSGHSPDQFFHTDECRKLQTKVEDLEWRDRWNATRIEILATRLNKTERAALDLVEQLERVRAERDTLLRSLLKASLEARP